MEETAWGGPTSDPINTKVTIFFVEKLERLLLPIAHFWFTTNPWDVRLFSYQVLPVVEQKYHCQAFRAPERSLATRDDKFIHLAAPQVDLMVKN